MDPEKTGKGLSFLTSAPGLDGIEVTDQASEMLRRTRPDVAIVTTTSAIEPVAGQIAHILDAGVNIVSTCEELVYPWFHNAGLAKKIDELARTNGATVLSADTLGWYGFDDEGAGIHDVIGTRCDPYTIRMLRGVDFDHTCHSNLTRALAAHTGLTLEEAEPHVHDVLNVFMCTGFTLDSHQYFKKASPVRPGDFIEFFAEIDLLGALSACPSGDCGANLPSGTAVCHPLRVDVFRCEAGALEGWQSPARSGYGGRHGAG